MAATTQRPRFIEFDGGSEPTSFLFEDDQCVVFEEKLNKQAPIHFLVVPKKNIPRLTETSADDEMVLGRMLLVAKQVALEKGLDRTGYHVMVDEHHDSKRLMSLHVFGRALHHMVWPVGPGCRL